MGCVDRVVLLLDRRDDGRYLVLPTVGSYEIVDGRVLPVAGNPFGDEVASMTEAAFVGALGG